MRIVLFAAILLTVASVPAAYASTLQLVTENGNVFSIDFDEILFLWEMQNPSNQTQAIAIFATADRQSHGRDNPHHEQHGN